jgi:hypothetical protein
MTGLGTGRRGREDKWCCLSFVSVRTLCLGPVAIGRKTKDVPTSTNVLVFYLCRKHSYGMSETGNRWIDIPFYFISLKQFSLHPQVRHMHVITPNPVPCPVAPMAFNVYRHRPPGHTSTAVITVRPRSYFALCVSRGQFSLPTPTG